MLILSIKSLTSHPFKYFYTYLCRMVLTLNKYLIFALGFASAVGLGACSHSSPEPVDYTTMPVADIASVMENYKYMSDSARYETIADYGAELKAFMKVVSGDSISDVLLEAWSSSAPVEVFTPAADSVYPSLAPIEDALGFTVAASRNKGLHLKATRFAAVVYGRPESIMFVDSVMLIALNHYLGADYEGYSHWPLYRRLAKTPVAMPYDIAEALVATAYPYSAPEADNTLFANMLYQGALTYAKLLTVKDANLADALGYDEETLRKLDNTQQEMWRTFVARRLLYDTSSRTIDRFILPSPVLRIEELEWPARAGRYIGYRIVESYMRHFPDTSLAFLLSPEFYLSSDVLRESGYMN